MWFRIVAGVFILGSVGAVAWLESRRRMRRGLERLERQRTLEKERTRIANDIHDDLGAQLTRIGMYCDPSQNASDRAESESAKLQHVYDATHELKRSMDEIVWAVNPCHDTFESLVNYLHKFAQDFLEVAGIRCRFNIPIDLPAWPLFAETRHNLFLAFKEALNNAAKHSKATEVRISLSVTSVGFNLIFEDNGRGFVPGPPDGVAAQNTLRGHGLKSIAHRLKEMGGDCQIISAPGQGARIVFVVPAQVGSARVGAR
jgi:signal transduction histidine kinase